MNTLIQWSVISFSTCFKKKQLVVSPRKRSHSIWISGSLQWVNCESIHVLGCGGPCSHVSIKPQLSGLVQMMALQCEQHRNGEGTAFALGSFSQSPLPGMFLPMWVIGWQGVLIFHFPSKERRFRAILYCLNALWHKCAIVREKQPGNKLSWAKYAESV